MDLVAPEPVTGELPGALVTVIQAQGLEHRHIEALEYLGGLFSPLATAEHEILQHDHRRQRRMRTAFEPTQRLQGALAPSSEQADAGDITLLQRLAERVVEVGVAPAIGTAMIDHRDHAVAAPDELRCVESTPVLVEA